MPYQHPGRLHGKLAHTDPDQLATGRTELVPWKAWCASYTQRNKYREWNNARPTLCLRFSFFFSFLPTKEEEEEEEEEEKKEPLIYPSETSRRINSFHTSRKKDGTYKRSSDDSESKTPGGSSVSSLPCRNLKGSNEWKPSVARGWTIALLGCPSMLAMGLRKDIEEPMNLGFRIDSTLPRGKKITIRG